jgi:hypothetical protein
LSVRLPRKKYVRTIVVGPVALGLEVAVGVVPGSDGEGEVVQAEAARTMAASATNPRVTDGS